MVGDERTEDVGHEVSGRAVTGAFKLGDVFEPVANGLNMHSGSIVHFRKSK